VNELASERAGESEPAITTMYYVLYVGVAKRKQTEYAGIPFFQATFLDEKQDFEVLTSKLNFLVPLSFT